jgi:hypothetical protein
MDLGISRSSVKCEGRWNCGGGDEGVAAAARFTLDAPEHFTPLQMARKALDAVVIAIVLHRRACAKTRPTRMV